MKVNNYQLNKKYFENVAWKNVNDSLMCKEYQTYIQDNINQILIKLHKLDAYNILFDLQEFLIETDKYHHSFVDFYKYFFTYIDNPIFINARKLGLKMVVEKIDNEIKKLINNKERNI